MQLRAAMVASGTSRVFVATDARRDDSEWWEWLAGTPLDIVAGYAPPPSTSSLGDGQVAIVEQWICAKAAYFVGMTSSTFTLRIMEERDILGQPPETTYNALCAADAHGHFDCETPTRWEPK